MQKRILNQRPTYNETVLEPSAGNYYPITSSIYISNYTTLHRITLYGLLYREIL